MSIFKTSGVILKMSSIKETEFLFDVFSYDYGKLKLKAKKSKKEKNLDVGYIINFEVNVKKENTIHDIKNIKIKSEFDYLGKNYEVILEYLELLQVVDKKCPYHMPMYEIYNIFHAINDFENISDEKLLFGHLKILHILGILPQEHKNIRIQKILSFVIKESIKNILKLKGLDEEAKKELKMFLMK